MNTIPQKNDYTLHILANHVLQDVPPHWATKKLVQTSFTRKASLPLCEALHTTLGGNSLVRDNTGETESAM